MGIVIGILMAWAALSVLGLVIGVALSNAGFPPWAFVVPMVAPIFWAVPVARWAALRLGRAYGGG